MSKQIDEKVVSMQFDNKQFESNVQTSMSTLDKLKEKLNFSGATKGLENVNAAAKDVNFSGISSGVETVRAKFSALEVMAVTTLANITNSAVNAGKKFVAAFTIDPIKTGFNEYELKMGSIQTIMSGTGESLEAVNQYLEELNKYSDQTIYSFSDMTTNIGKFTNAGVKLEDAVAAIKGVSNAAAVSGANANEASRAMYNFAQALSAGYVKLIDWKSIENANMATVEFKNHLLEAGVAAGTLTKTTDGMYKTLKGNVLGATRNFNECLQDQWMTTEVLVSTLRDYSDAQTDIGKKAYAAAQDVKIFSMLMDTLKEAAQSGWASTWEIIIGDFNEAKSLFTKMSEVFGNIISKSAEARNTLLEGALSTNWKKLSKEIGAAGVSVDDFQKTLIETGKKHGVITDKMIEDAGGFEASLKSGWATGKLIAEALREFVGITDKTSESAENLTKKFEEFHKIADKVIHGDFGNGAERVKKLTEAGYDYATIQSLVNEKLLGTKANLEDMSDAQLKNIGYTEEQIKTIRELAEQAEKTGTPLNDLIKKMGTEKPSGRELLIDSFSNILTAVKDVLSTVKETWEKVFPPLTDEQKQEKLYKLIEKFHDFTENIQLTQETIDKLSRSLEGLFRLLEIIWTVTGGVGGILVKFANIIRRSLNLDLLGLAAIVGDNIVAFRQWLFVDNKLIGVFKAIGTEIQATTQKIIDWVKAFMKLPVVQENLKKLGDAFLNTGNKLKEHFNGTIAIFDKFVAKLKAMDNITLDGLKQAIKDLWKDICDHFGKIGGSFSSLQDVIKGFMDSVTKNFGGIGTAFEKLREKIFNFFDRIRSKISENVGMGELLTIGIGGGMIITISQLGKALKKFTGILETFLNVPKAISSTITKYGDARKIEAKAAAVKNLAIALALMAGSLWLVAQIPSDKLLTACGVIAGLCGVLALLSLAMSKIGKIQGVTRTGSLTLLAMAISVLILAESLKKIQELDQKTIGESLLVLITVMAALATFCGALGKYAPQLSAGALTLIAFAAAIKILVSALSDINELGVDSNLLKSLGVLIAIMAALALLAGICNGSIKIGKGKISPSGFSGAAVSIIAMVVALKLFVGVLKDISNFDLEKAKDNLGAFIVIFGTFAILMAMSKFAGANAAKAGLGIIGMAAALLIVISAVKMLAKLHPSDMRRATAMVAQLLVTFAAIVALSNFAGKYAARAGVMLLLMSGAILILTAAIVVLSHVDEDGLKRALATILWLEAAMALLIYVTQYAKDCQKNLVIMAVTIGLLAVSLGALAMIKPENLKSATVALSSVMAMFALLVASTYLAKSATATLAIMAGVVAVLGGILFLLAGLPVDSTMAVSESLSLLLLSLSASFLIISKSNMIMPGAYATLGIMLLVVAGLGLILAALSAMNIKNTLEIAESLSILLLSISASCFILSSIGPIASIAAAGAAKMLALLGIVAAIILAVGAIAAAIPGSGEFIDKMATSLSKIGNAIGSFFGGIVAGAVEKAAAGMDSVAEALVSYYDKISPIKDWNSITQSAEAAKTLAQVGKTIAGGLFGGLPNEEKLNQFASSMKAYANGLVDYSGIVSSLTAADIENINISAKAGKGLTEFANTIPRTGDSLVTAILGKKDMGTFGESLKAFGSALIDYAGSISGLDKSAAEGINRSAEAGKALTALAESVPRTGGWASAILGSNAIDEFGEKLKSFATSLLGYAGLVQYISASDVEHINTSVEASKGLVALADSIPRTGDSIFSVFTGDKNIAKFGEDLKSYGQALVDYAGIVNGLDATAVASIQSSVDASKALVELANSIPDSGGLFSGLFGGNDIDVFGINLKSFGSSLSDYNNSVKDVDCDKLRKVTTEFGKIADFASGLKGMDTSGMSTFGKDLKALAKSGVTSFISEFDNSNTKITNAATKMVTTFTTGANSKKDSMTKAVTKLVTDCLDSMNKKVSDFKTSGTDSMQKYIDGVNSKSDSTKESFSTITKSSVSEVRKYHGSRYNSEDTFYGAGMYLVEGFANGISANSYKAEAQARAMAKAAAAAAARALDERSPSKVGYQIGDYFGQGFVNGIGNTQDKADSAGGDVAKSAITGLRSALSKIGNFVESGIDTQPTIRPVLDLSNVESGTGRINALFSRTQAIRVSSGMSRVTSGEDQNGANSAESGSTFNFTQNNYSPKSLSRVEIYRQTKNQFSAMERMAQHD